jgi:tRNA modification GTPase
MNGKLDLAQAEAIQMLIASKSELAQRSAKEQLEGALSQRINHFRQELTRIAAILEAWIDFPEEGLEFTSMEEIIEELGTVRSQMARLVETFHEGKIIHDGISLCLLGSPNVGKSSLMNALLGKNRSIVTDIAGTTRDFIEEELRLGSMHFRLIDTAGISSTQDPIEREGMARSRNAMEESDLILLVLDASRPLSPNDRELIGSISQKRAIVIWNKVDLSMPQETIPHEPAVFLSAKSGQGMDVLRQAIEQSIWKEGPPSKEEVILSSHRHYQALQEAVHACETVIEGLRKKLSPEFVSFDMQSCLHHLGAITGANVTEEVLSSIFSQFCVGK